MIEPNFGCLKCGAPLIKYEGPLWVCVMCGNSHDKPHEEGAHKKKPVPKPWWKRLLGIK